MWVENLTRQLVEYERQQEGRPFKLEAPDRRLVVNWTMQAWTSLEANTIRNGFKQYSHQSLHNSDNGVEETHLNDYTALAERLEELNVAHTVVSDTEDVIERGIGSSGVDES
jgi:hypothetical protein